VVSEGTTATLGSGSPSGSLYLVEPLIQGRFAKHNSNAGWVGNSLLQGASKEEVRAAQDATARFTPQAFSHFTFEHTKHDRIVVDVQGVGDIYTDPQLHTIDGKGYGAGNSGAIGIAAFFRTHLCNPVCWNLGLKPFGLSRLERKTLAESQMRQPRSWSEYGDQRWGSRAAEEAPFAKFEAALGCGKKKRCSRPRISSRMKGMVRLRKSDFPPLPTATDGNVPATVASGRIHWTIAQQYLSNAAIKRSSKFSRHQLKALYKYHVCRASYHGILEARDLLAEWSGRTKTSGRSLLKIALKTSPKNWQTNGASTSEI